MSQNMTVRDVTAAYESLKNFREPVAEATRLAVEKVCAGRPSLRDATMQLLDHDRSQDDVFRLLPLAIAGAVTGDEAPALPVCTLSRLWWAGAETFDDLNDGKFDASAAGISVPNALIASVTCLTLLPQLLIQNQHFTDELTLKLSGELARTTLHSADGQLDDLSPDEGDQSWVRSMRSYAGKTGSPYARDLALTGHLVGLHSERLTGLRTFGQLFGVLQQLANDRAAADAAEDEDLSNGTRTLLVAHAMTTASSAERAELSRLRTQARNHPEARVLLRDRLTRPEVAVGYNARIGAIRHRLSLLLDQLVSPSDHRDLIGWMIDVRATTAELSLQEAGTRPSPPRA
jgi:hypothetical protein